MKTKLLSLYGLKCNPFAPEMPVEALHPYAKLENFFWRMDQKLYFECFAVPSSGRRQKCASSGSEHGQAGINKGSA